MSKRIAYVTGGMGGIGTAICTRLCKDGYTVVAGCGPNSTRKDKWLATMREQGFDIHASEGNVSNWESTKAASRRCAPRSAKWTCWSTTPASPATASSAR